MIARDGTQRPTEERLQALRDYYTGNVDGAGDVEDLFREIDALTAQIEELEEPIRDFLLQWERHSSEQDDFVVDAVFGLRAALAQSDPPED